MQTVNQRSFQKTEKIVPFIKKNYQHTEINKGNVQGTPKPGWIHPRQLLVEVGTGSSSVN